MSINVTVMKHGDLGQFILATTLISVTGKLLSLPDREGVVDGNHKYNTGHYYRGHMLFI